MIDHLRVSVDGWTAVAGPGAEPDRFGCYWDLAEIEGWFGGLAVRADSEDRTGADGAHDGQPYFAARTVTLAGLLDAPDPAALLAAMRRLAGVLAGRRTGTLVVEEVATGITRSAECRLDVQGRAKRTGETSADWEITVYCPDPLRYGPPLQDSTGLPKSGGGLAWPLFTNGFLDWGQPGDPGQVILSNGGTADAPILFRATAGPLGLPEGFEISAGGRRLTYAAVVPPRQTIWIDTATGAVLAEGTADRRSELTHADWLHVPAADPETGVAGELTIQFTSLGGAYDEGAQLVAQWTEADT
ncbi:phage tail family protein [Blastococcus sp. BMG 814]|uniref:Phage tail family protein n=1 Tax=Blastococcus carthaginiensis TaxID=3050034 RepID=A0ABT9I9D7_9ACTN|nr:phage tail family protein [Blastococcus carthaginiensis]